MRLYQFLGLFLFIKPIFINVKCFKILETSPARLIQEYSLVDILLDSYENSFVQVSSKEIFSLPTLWIKTIQKFDTCSFRKEENDYRT